MEFSGEVRTFLTIILTGGILGFVFDVYRVAKNTFRLKKLTVSATDALYWLLATAITFAALVAVNGGQIRLYVLIALGLGAVLYFYFISRYVIQLLVKTIKFSIKTKIAMEKTCKIVFLTIIAKPGYFIYKTAARPLNFGVRIFKRICKRLVSADKPPE